MKIIKYLNRDFIYLLMNTKEDCIFYDKTIKKQEGKCAICKKEFKYRLYINHSHKCCGSGYRCNKCRRGLLCRSCNSSLGFCKEDPNILRNIGYFKYNDILFNNAKEYLEKFIIV
jgi:hypothetical protein